MPSDRVVAVEDLRSVLAATGHSIVLIGAYAREVTFDVAVGRAHQRATLDVDAAVAMDDWDEYEGMATQIAATGRFRRLQHDNLRFTHENGTELLLLPYGAIARPDARLRWPNDPTRTLSVEGFDTLAAHSVTATIGSTLIAVADLTHIVALKLFAYADRAGRTRKDLVFILRHATDGLQERVFAELPDDVLHERAYLEYGPLLIGVELRARLDPTSVDRLRTIVDAAALRASDLPSVHRSQGVDGPDHTRRRFDALAAGLVIADC